MTLQLTSNVSGLEGSGWGASSSTSASSKTSSYGDAISGGALTYTREGEAGRSWTVNDPVQEDAWVRQKFQQLADDWRSETEHLSSIHAFIHPAYQQIVGMGMVAVPFILEDLRANGGHWFWALRYITGENPASDVQPGDLIAQAEAWLQWGVSRHLILAGTPGA